MKNKKRFGELFFTVFILCFLAVGFILNLGVLKKPWKRYSEETIDFPQWIAEVKDAYVAGVAYKENFINLNGLFARMTGKTVYNKVAVLDNGMLDYDEMVDLDMTDFSNGVSEFNDFLSREEIPFLYIQAPFKTDVNDELLPYGVENYGNQNASELIAALEKNNVDTLDLRQTISATPDTVNKYFYRTDHHWNTHGAFEAFRETLPYLQATFPDREFDSALADASNWNQEVYEEWFLGSRGKRVGKYFGGVDDLVIYTPKFETDMSCYVTKYLDYYSGDFAEAVIRSDYLDEPDLFGESPYCAYIGGDYPLVHHVNRLAKNDIKVLLIKDSFSLPFQSFLSTAVHELDVLDPRHYKEATIAEYVTASQPDVVIMMTNPSVFYNSQYYNTGVDKAQLHLQQTEIKQITHQKTISLSAAETTSSEYKTIATHLTPNTKYTLSFQKVDVKKGDVDSVNVTLYNATTKKVLSSQVFDITKSSETPYEWTFLTPENSSDDLRVLVYCGRCGESAGKQVTYHNVDLYQYKVPKK